MADSEKAMREKEEEILRLQREFEKFQLQKEQEIIQLQKEKEIIQMQKEKEIAELKASNSSQELILVNQDLKMENEPFVEGRYGRIYRGSYKEQEVVVKRLVNVGDGAELTKQFYTEALLLAPLSHKNIVKLIEYRKDTLDLILERAECSLLDKIRKQKKLFPSETIQDFLIQIAEGMNYLHSKDIAHRDLKSPNILVFPDNRIAIGDFGFAKVKQMVSSTTTTGKGTYRWMAPEMMSRRYGKVTVLVDVYSYAMVALELVSLKLPFEDWEDAQILGGVPNGERPDIPFHCNPFFKELITQCWQGEPTKRPSFPIILEKIKGVTNIGKLDKVKEPTVLAIPGNSPSPKQMKQGEKPLKLKIAKQWSFVEPMHSKKCNHSSVVHGEFIYSIGGEDGRTKVTSVERYNIKSRKWELFASLKCARHQHSSATCGDSIFCMGGKLSDDSITNTMEKYDVDESKEWYSVAPMMSARTHLGAVTYRESIFVTGGFDGISELSTVEKYNTQTNKWSAVSSMISKRSRHVSVICGDSIYSIGGFDGSQYLTSAERYDIQIGQWISIASMKQKRECHAVVSIGESIFVLGGWGGSPLKSMEMYDVRSNQWVDSTPLNTPRYYLTAAIYGNFIFVTGGYNGNQPFKTVEKLQIF